MPIPTAHYRAVPGVEILFEQPWGRYGLAPPALLDFHPADPARASEFLTVVSRPEAVSPPEAVVVFRDALVIDGRYVISKDGIGIDESYFNVRPGPALATRQKSELARIAAGEVVSLPDGPPVVVLFMQDCNNFGHNIAEVLPRLLHLQAAGIHRFRLLVPTAALPFRDVVEFALRTLALDAELVTVPDDSILRVAALHWVTLVGHGWSKSPTVLRMMERLRDAVPHTLPHRHLFVARPEGSRRPVTNGAEVAELAQGMGFTVVEPSALPFPDQIALFKGARRVAGPMGAGLTLIAAMDQGGHVAMFEGGNCDYFYWDLACMAGLAFDWAFTASVGPFDLAQVYAPMTIPPALAHRTLRGLLA